MSRLIACFGLCALAACSSNPIRGINSHANPETVHDTTGATFGWQCDANACVVTPKDPTPPCGAGSKYIFFTERFVRVCSATPLNGDPVAGFGAEYAWCRPLACMISAECPSFDGAEYLCLDGLCQREGLPMHRYDVEALCLSTHPRSGCPSSSDPEVMRIETLITSMCTTGNPDTCTVPAECPQP